MHFQCHMPRIRTLAVLLNGGQWAMHGWPTMICSGFSIGNNFFFFFLLSENFVVRRSRHTVLRHIMNWFHHLFFIATEFRIRLKILHDIARRTVWIREPAALHLQSNKWFSVQSAFHYFRWQIAHIMTDRWMESSAMGKCDRRLPAHTPSASVKRRVRVRAYTFHLTKYDTACAIWCVQNYDFVFREASAHGRTRHQTRTHCRRRQRLCNLTDERRPRRTHIETYIYSVKNRLFFFAFLLLRFNLLWRSFGR